ncbi:hypothetical protein ACN47E_007250 [Coniothyrium glycines]
MSLAGASFANHRHNPLFIDLLASQQSYAAGETVQGHVRVDPKVKPTHISITFKGYSVIHKKDATGITINLFTASRPLFESTGAGENFDILRKGTSEDGKVELPFDFTFPHTVDLPPPADRTWHHSQDTYNHPRFQHSPGFPLPPTCSSSSASANVLTPRIVYLLEARMESSLPDGPAIIRHELTYVPPAPNYHPMLLQPDLNFPIDLPKHLCHYKFVRTRKLYPGYAQRSKASRLRDTLVDKELFFGLETVGEIPHARFNYFATPARVLILGAQIPMTMTLQHLERSASLVDPPALFLRRVRVHLVSVLSIFVPNLKTAKKTRKEEIDVARETIVLMDTKFEKGSGHPLTNGLQFSELGDVTLKGNEKHKLLPSFTSYGLTLEYELQVDIWGECADREFAGIACKSRVQVVTDYQVAAAMATSALDRAPGPEYHELDPLNDERGDSLRSSEHSVNPFIHELDPPPPLEVPAVSTPAVPPPPYRYA